MYFFKCFNIINKKINVNSIQNNQRKDNLKIINQSNKRTIIMGREQYNDKLIRVSSSYKRFMFGISNVRNLKKSGDLIIVGNENVVKIGSNTTAASKLKSLDLANKQQLENIEQVLNSNTTTTVVIKNIVTGVIHPMKVSRSLATYGKIDKRYPIE